MSSPYVLTQTLSGNVRSDFTGYLGFSFDTGANTPTVSHLGRWKHSGNNQTHNLYLYKFVDGVGGDVQIATVSVDMTTGSDSTFVYTALGSPVVLLASNRYYVISQEVNGGPDDWLDQDGTLDTFTSNVGTVYASCYTTTLASVSFALTAPPARSYIPMNFQVSAGATPVGTMWLH